MEKRCANCKRYPFCNRCNYPTDCCENWEKRRIENETEQRRFNKTFSS